MPIDEHLRILIIDDNPEIHKDFIKILTTHSLDQEKLSHFENEIFGKATTHESAFPHYDIDSAFQGHEGVEKIKKALEEKKPYALAFVDIRMPPGWDGIETIKHIWELDADIQIVICTAYSDYSWEYTIEKLGQKPNLLILKKPFDHVAVRQLTWSLTRKWQLLQASHKYIKLLEQRIDERTQLLRESMSVMRGTLELSADGIVVINNENRVIEQNTSFVKLWRLPRNLIGKADAHLLLDYMSDNIENPNEFLTMVNEVCQHSELIKLDKLVCKDGRIFECYSQPYQIDEKIIGRVWSFLDVTAKDAEPQDKIQFKQTHDLLTGSHSRTFLIDKMNDAVIKSRQNKSTFGVLFFDIDRFQSVNSALSQEVGDQLLQAITKRVKSSLRAEDELARMDSDEFAVLITLLNNESDMQQIAASVLQSFNRPFKIAEHEIVATPSIGVALFPKDGNDVKELLRHADSAMYWARERGGNQIQFYTDQLDKQNLERLEKEARLRLAIENNEFALSYHPQFDLVTHKLVSLEALIHWVHPVEGNLLSMSFMPLAEETGIINLIGEWILKTACEQNKKWQDMGFPSVRVTVNLTDNQFKQPNLVEMIRSILTQTHLDPGYLEISLTENIIFKNKDSSKIISELKKMGVQIELDQFRAGYSALNYLKDLCIDRIKVNALFVKDVDTNKVDDMIIQSIISTSQKVMAEHADSQAQEKQMEEIKKNYFDKLLADKDIEAILKNSDRPLF